MRITYGIILTFIYLTVFIISYIKEKDIFSPLCFFSLMQFIAYVPGLMFFEQHLRINLNKLNTFYVFIMQIIFLIFIWLGIKIYKQINKKSLYYTIIEKKGVNNKAIGLLLFSIGLFATVYFIILSGGIRYIVNNIQLDYAAGKSYLMSLQKLMVIGMLFFFGTNKKPNSILIVIAFVIYALTVIIFTRRAPIMEALLLIVMCYHYRVKKIKIRNVFKPKTILLGVIFSIIIVSLPMLRNPSGFQTYSSIFEIFEKGWGQINNVFKEYSFTSRDAFVYTNYKANNMYYGRTVINLITAPLPSSRFPWKPPVDDGVYLANFVRGYYVLPPSNAYPINNSYPFSSQGSMYANFGVVGVICGAILTGVLYAHVYKMLKDTKYHIFMIFIYQTIIYKFALSSKNITQTLILIVLLGFSFKVLTRLKIKKKRFKLSLGGGDRNVKTNSSHYERIDS